MNKTTVSGAVVPDPCWHWGSSSPCWRLVFAASYPLCMLLLVERHFACDSMTRSDHGRNRFSGKRPVCSLMGVRAPFESDCVLVASALSTERLAAGDRATNNAFSGAVDVRHMAAGLLAILTRLGSTEISLGSQI